MHLNMTQVFFLQNFWMTHLGKNKNVPLNINGAVLVANKYFFDKNRKDFFYFAEEYLPS